MLPDVAPGVVPAAAVEAPRMQRSEFELEVVRVVVDVDGREAERDVEVHPFVEVESFILHHYARCDIRRAVGGRIHFDDIVIAAVVVSLM